MKTLSGILLLILIATVPAAAQRDSSEREIRSLLAEFEQAAIKGDIAFMERVWAEDYTYSTSTGRTGNRAQALDYLKQQKDKPTFKMKSYKTENQQVRLIGNAAIVTGDWTLQATSVDSSADEPHTDKGRNTIVLEKRNGRWMIIAEHESELPHDRKLMEQQILTAGRAYNELKKRLHSGRAHDDLVKQGEIKTLERILANEYSYTGRDGEISNKAKNLESYKTNSVKIESAEILEQNVRIISNSSAVERGLIRYTGTREGKPFDITKRYTTTWAFRAYRWQIVAEHSSAVA